MRAKERLIEDLNNENERLVTAICNLENENKTLSKNNLDSEV